MLCGPGSPWSSRRRSCIERTRVASAAPWSSYCTAWHYCCRSRPLRPPSLASGVSGHPGQASSRGGQRSCRRGSDVREDVGHCFVPRPTTQGPPLLSKKHANRVTGKFSWTRRRRVPTRFSVGHADDVYVLFLHRKTQFLFYSVRFRILVETPLGCVLEIKSFLANFGPVKGLKNSSKKQRNQNFTKESEKIVIRKLGYRKDSYSKTGVQRKMLVFPKKNLITLPVSYEYIPTAKMIVNI